MGNLIAAVISNPRYAIDELLQECALRDPFMQRLIQVSKAFREARENGDPVQDIHCLILRNDFMIDQPSHSLKLVEYNTIATGFVCLGSRTAKIHQYILDKYGDELPLNYSLCCKNTGLSALLEDPDVCALPFHHNREAQFENFVAKFDEATRLYR
mmetsp:Transcript_1847/g.2622  ORF Transcript_1847/g.2622 Transcript_1847/m.2622 type:complete len:156 (+) Transcript_1847:258-725(+)|eukprot:CAMPEP_0170463686 /NCGR_PEP_ID=MMETSP0123-20130129/8703_1 /TAXON_ID=182087 /ORGANISM="Favella ehrenbergii, Strain Fehren 1" /LENGTH=155 /DNA_ID=CAMNT_0010729177 /DNA_START=229 /DNA_END=696 /DNA_ORIENTATION=+